MKGLIFAVPMIEASGLMIRSRLAMSYAQHQSSPLMSMISMEIWAYQCGSLGIHGVITTEGLIRLLRQGTENEDLPISLLPVKAGTARDSKAK